MKGNPSSESARPSGTEESLQDPRRNGPQQPDREPSRFHRSCRTWICHLPSCGTNGHTRSHSMGHSRSSLHSPLTPPSPSADFSLLHPQFSPPSPSVAIASKPGSSQPISIALQRPSYTPRGSPHTGIPPLNLSRMADADDYVLPHTRYSTSPGRLMPTLSPPPEVLLNTMTQMKTEKADSRKSGAGSNNES